jgi:magnesium and cobalt exporter, CNNM family
MNEWLFFLLLTFICIVIQAFFSMFEMAAVSFNKIRLHYFVNKNYKRAIWLNHLLNNPSRLFGTTLIGVNTFLQIGSEASRKFYEAVNLNPDFAPITQIFLVLIFAELAPMFSARRFPEHVAMLLIPVIIFVSKLLTPVIILIDWIAYFFTKLLGQKKSISLFLSREEIQRAFEEIEMGQKEDVNTVVGNIFSLKNKVAEEIMVPLGTSQLASSESTLKEIKHALSVKYSPFILIFHNSIENIVGVVYPRDLLRAKEDEKIISYSKPPWFITEKDSIITILNQFRKNNQSVAIVLNSTGEGAGLVTLESINDIIFGSSIEKNDEPLKKINIVERTLPGTMLLAEFNKQFTANLLFDNVETLSDMMIKLLEHHPIKGESIQVNEYEFIVLESSLLGVKTLSVKSLL